MLTGLREPTVLRVAAQSPWIISPTPATRATGGVSSRILMASHSSRRWAIPKIWPYPGLYLSTTDYLVPNFGKYDARHYLDSEHVLFMVAPDEVRMAVTPKVLCCRGVVTDLKTGRRWNASSATSARAITRERALSRSPPILGSPDVPRPAARVIVSAGTIKCGPVKPPRDSRCSSPLECSPGYQLSPAFLSFASSNSNGGSCVIVAKTAHIARSMNFRFVTAGRSRCRTGTLRSARGRGEVFEFHRTGVSRAHFPSSHPPGRPLRRDGQTGSRVVLHRKNLH